MAKPNRSRKGAEPQARPQLEGEITYVDVPHPPASAMNRERPVSALLQAQLEHIHHAETARLPKSKRDGRVPAGIGTEAEAASYIAAVTTVLRPHPRQRARSKPKR